MDIIAGAIVVIIIVVVAVAVTAVVVAKRCLGDINKSNVPLVEISVKFHFGKLGHVVKRNPSIHSTDFSHNRAIFKSAWKLGEAKRKRRGRQDSEG